MPIKVPARITKDWVRENCNCIRRKEQPTWLLCRESCPLHCTFDPPSESAQESIAEATKQLGWRLDWYRDLPAPKKEKRP